MKPAASQDSGLISSCGRTQIDQIKMFVVHSFFYNFVMFCQPGLTPQHWWIAAQLGKGVCLFCPQAEKSPIPTLIIPESDGSSDGCEKGMMRGWQKFVEHSVVWHSMAGCINNRQKVVWETKIPQRILSGTYCLIPALSGFGFFSIQIHAQNVWSSASVLPSCS